MDEIWLSRFIWLLIAFYVTGMDTGNEADVKEERPNEPEDCPYIDPLAEMERWNDYDFSACRMRKLRPTEAEADDYERYMYGEQYYSYNIFASDRIGARRKLNDTETHEKCRSVNHDVGDRRASIVVIYHNEAFSVLVRMLNSIFRETPPQLVMEVVLYDDFSDRKLRVDTHLNAYVEIQRKKLAADAESVEAVGWTEKVKMHAAEKREGLIRAKVYASRLASAEANVLIFLDSHCEVTSGWVEPLLAPIHQYSTNVVLPVVDLIDPFKFEYSKAMISRGTFDWSLKFAWDYFDWSYFDDTDNYVRPFRTVAPSGGLLAIDAAFFRRIGEYDMGMEIWGAENIELAIRIWLCGGQLLTAPCSRVGHVFRHRRPYSARPGVDTALYNALRTASVWLDDYQENFFYERPIAKRLEAGDVSDRLTLKSTLKCRPFSWFVENVHPTLKSTMIKRKKTEL